MGHFDDDRESVTITGTPDTVRALYAGLKSLYDKAGDGLDAKESVMVERLMTDLREALGLDEDADGLEKFRATRTRHENLGDIVAEYGDCESAGWSYQGCLCIEDLPAEKEEAFLTIGNCQHTGTLAEMERLLYEWAVAEEIVP